MLWQAMERSGGRLFRHRGWLPILVIAAALPAFVEFDYLFHRHEAQEIWTFICVAPVVLGQTLRFITVAQAPPFTSGRNRRHQVAEVLNTEGAYSIVRNPLYLGNCLAWLGLAAIPHSFWLLLSVALAFWLYHERVILAEESFLVSKFGDQFRLWAEKTPTFIPNPFLWRKTSVPFSFRTALGREYVNLFALTSAFALLDFIADSRAERRMQLDQGWLIAWLIALALFVVIRVIKKRTSLLNVPGRAW